ncbi:MAG: PKD domain-containing protein [Chloroflexi bacterium]|nr:PKD domain-containing protein [Chloroflexota bacterium]
MNKGFRLRIRSRSVLQAAALALLLAGLVMGRPSVAEAADPIANAGGPYSGDEGQQITFTGDASDAEDPTSSLTFEWDFDFDGSFAIAESGVNLTSPNHTYTDNGSFTVALRVKDTGNNISSVSTAAVTISNVPPTASAGGPYTVDEGSALSYNGSATDPGNDTLTFEWDFDYDNTIFTVDASGDNLTTPSNTYLNDASKTVGLRVRDDDGGISSIVTASVTVNNVPPTANAGTAYTDDEGSSITFTGTATDPGNETLTYEWDFTYSGGSFNVDTSGSGLTTPSHIYTADGDFTVALRVRDDDSVSNIATASVSVTNVLPTANAGGPYTGNLGSPVTFAGSATDPGGDSLTYEWDFEYDGNTFDTVGATTAKGVSLTGPSYTYTGGGTYTVALRVSDDDGTSAIVTGGVTIGGATATPTPLPTNTPAPVVSSGGGGGGGGGGLKKTKTPTPKPTKTPTPAPTSTPAPQATATPVPVFESEEQTSSLSPEVTVSTEDLAGFESALTAALGTDVDISDGVVEVVITDGGLVARTLVTGVSDSQPIVGQLDVALGNLVINTVDGVGTASLALDVGLNVEGSATVEVVDGAIEVAMSDLRLVFVPEAPDATTLDGGSPDVTDFGVNFNVGLNVVPDNASLTVQFVKSSSAFSVRDNDAIRQAVKDLGMSIQDSENDIAFAVNVGKSGITNDDLGANTVTMTVSAAWHDRMLAEGKAIAITKINDLGLGFSSLASCSVAGDTADCSAEFSGEASGFSLFILMGVSGEATPTATATQLPTATPLPKATSTPRPVALGTSASSPTATFTSVPPTNTPASTSTSVPPTPTRTSTSVPTATPVVVAAVTTEPEPPPPDEGTGFPVAAFIGIAVGAVALFVGAAAYLWKTGRFLLLLGFWRRFSETGRQS